MATNDGNGPFGALAEFFSPSRPASAPLDAQTDHNNTAHNNPANISPVNLDMSSGSGTEPDHDASAHPSARDTMQSAGSVHIVSTNSPLADQTHGNNNIGNNAVGSDQPGGIANPDSLAPPSTRLTTR